ncbi:MAG TPA: FixH family protein [Afifellaceae bacterium]|nr:FixH family protein [Afifellaceae bacterium]
MNDFKPIEGEFTGRHMLIIMIAFFGVIIGVNLLMATVANRSWTGLVVKNSYVASQNFNRKLEAARRVAALGWVVDFELDAGHAALRLADRSGPITGMDVTLKLWRPTNESEDVTVTLGEAAAGEYRAEIALGFGVWSADLTATAEDGEALHRHRRIVVPLKGGS